MQEKQRGGAGEEAKSRRVRERLQERGIVQGTECLRELVVRGEEERGRTEVMEGKRSLEGEGKKGEQADEWALKTPDKGIQQPPSSSAASCTGGELPHTLTEAFCRAMRRALLIRAADAEDGK